MKVHACFALATGLLFAAGDSRTIGSDKDVENLQGIWVAVSLEAEGRKAPQEIIRGFKIFIKANRIIFTPDTDKRESSFKVDASKRPKEIVITPLDGPHKGHPQRGLYSFEKDRLKLCVNNEKEQPPAEFVTRPADGLRLIVLKRQAP